ncbi:MAG TPA: hypothetical protein VFZ59_01140 [Verrucomicrobiae bacterium]|nr:hypothetical protein [Verrucomicrobiae bacterium]
MIPVALPASEVKTLRVASMFDQANDDHPHAGMRVARGARTAESACFKNPGPQLADKAVRTPMHPQEFSLV